MKAVLLALSLFCAATGMAVAQSDPAPGFPSKPIRWVVGFAPGASNDLIARTVAQRLTEIWGKLGMDIVGGSPADATRYVMTQVERVRGLIKAGVLTPE